MKKVLLTATLVAIFGFAATAQEQGEIRIGVGLRANTVGGIDDSNGEHKIGLGLNFGGEYFVTDAISIAPSYTLGFGSDLPEGFSYKFNFFNIDGRYYFGESGFYGLAGLGFASVKIEDSGFSATGSETGINLGVGYAMELSDVLLLDANVKYNTVKVGNLANLDTKSPLVFGLGLAYRLGQ